MKLFIKTLKRLLIILSVVIGIYFTLAISLSFIPFPGNSKDCEPTEKIYISTNGVHLDIIVSKTALSSKLIEHLPQNIKGHYLAFGWGDEDFYLNTPTWDDLTFSTAFKAMLLPSPTAMHVTYHQQKYKHWQEITICTSQLETLNQYLDESFQKEEGGQFQKIQSPGYSKNDVFYKATGNYSCITTCNEWVNSALKKMEIKTSIWSPFDFGVLYFQD